MGEKKICKMFEKNKLSDKKEIEDYIKEIKDGKYLCLNCGRVAINKEKLCKPIKI